MGGPSREVTIRFSGDFSELRKEMAGMAKEFKKFNEEIGKAEKARADVTEKAEAKTNKAKKAAMTDEEKDREGRWKRQEKADEYQFKQSMKRIDDRKKAEEKAAKDIERAEIRKHAEIDRLDKKQFDARMKAIAEREKAEQRAIQNAARAQKVYEGKERRAYGQELKVDRFAEGAVRQFAGVAKNAMMLGALSEQDTEKVLRNMIKIQLVYETILGAKEGVELIQRAWRAYAYSVKLAAEAHAALAIAQAAGGAAGGASGAGRAAAGGVGGAAAAGAAGGLGSKILGGMKWAGGLGMSGLGMLGGGIKSVASNPYAIMAAGLASYTDLGATAYSNRNNGGGFLNSFDASRNAFYRPTRWGSAAGSLVGEAGNYVGLWGNAGAAKTGRIEANRAREQERASRADAIYMLNHGQESARQGLRDETSGLVFSSRMSRAGETMAGGGDIETRLKVAKEITAEAQKQQAVAAKKSEEAVNTLHNERAIAEVIQKEEQAARQVLTARRQENDELRNIVARQREVADLKQGMAKSSMDRAFDRGQNALNTRTSLAESLLDKDHFDQMQILEVKKKLQSGKSLDKYDEKIYRESGLDRIKEVSDLHGEQIRKKMKGTPAEEITRELGDEFNRAKKDFMDANVNFNHQVQIKVELDKKTKDIGKEDERIIKSVMKELEEILNRRLGRENNAAMQDITSPAGKDKQAAYDFSGRMAAVAGQV